MLKSSLVGWLAALLMVGVAAEALAQENPVGVQQQLYDALARAM